MQGYVIIYDSHHESIYLSRTALFSQFNYWCYNTHMFHFLQLNFHFHFPLESFHQLLVGIYHLPLSSFRIRFVEVSCIRYLKVFPL